MGISGKGRLFVVGTSAAGLVVVGHCIDTLLTRPVSHEWLILACLTLLSGSFTVKVPGIPARISVSETFVFTSVLLFGPCAGTIIVALDTLVVSLGARRSARAPLRVVFNFSAAALSIWLASSAFYGVAGVEPLHEHSVPLPSLILPLALLTLIYFLLNSSLVAVALSFERHQAAFTIWKNNFLWLGVNYFGGASVAVLLVSYTKNVDFTALGIIVPLLVISYLTFKTSLGRLEDANRHVAEVNRLYLSTIETLATAIDAKDQVTHGHIRRVQRFALGLASRLNVSDEAQLKAIEAAALLHDMGKLVVPEHILNKPGKLTAAEFEKMKLHASVGAQILSSIEFPYPVVPIVRHHHENWDGTGYPDGLRGTAIPLGARILSVVDCFDALTSDRPYRPKLSDREAIDILLQRRGSMYDPLVVDTFIDAKESLLREVQDARDNGPVDEAVLTVREHPPIGGSKSVVLQTVQADAGAANLIASVLADVRARTDSVVALLFLRDVYSDEIVCVGSDLAGSCSPPEVSFSVGARVSGWVAANGRPVVNADAVLDVGGVAGLSDLGLRKCACAPVYGTGDVVGAITIYTSDPRGYSERDGVYLESVCRSLEQSDLVSRIFSAVKLARHSRVAPRAVH